MLQVENCFPPLRATHPRQIGYGNLKGEIVDRSNERTQQEAESNLNKVHKTTFNCGFGFAVMLLAAQCDVMFVVSVTGRLGWIIQWAFWARAWGPRMEAHKTSK